MGSRVRIPATIIRTQVVRFSEQKPPEDEEKGGGRKIPTGFEKLLKKSKKS